MDPDANIEEQPEQARQLARALGLCPACGDELGNADERHHGYCSLRCWNDVHGEAHDEWGDDLVDDDDEPSEEVES